MKIEYDDLRHRVEFHRLHSVWCRFKSNRQLSQEWANFRVFFEWAVSHGWKRGMIVRRIDKDKPAGPDNCWLEGKENPEEDVSEIKAGYKNSPCKGCRSNGPSGCDRFRTCARYRFWINKSWDEIRVTCKGV